MKKLLILSALLFMLIITACGKAKTPEAQVESQAVNTPAQFATTTPAPKPTPELTRKPTETVEPVNEGAVSPIARPVSPVPAPATEIGGNMDSPTLPATEQDLVAKAKEMLMQLPAANLNAGEISLLNMEAREWSDASLGCPQSGMMYAQVLTSGYIIVLEAGGSQYEFHTNERDQVVLCTIDGKNAAEVLPK